ncbi:MAG TPA: helix-turn-helix transcriptional regulator [Actinoplanes sp.]|jgi:tetratricopeptide (TPR) repeat protein
MDSTVGGAVQKVFGVALRHLRNEAGLSLRALGEAVHYDYSRLSRVEKGEHLIDPARVPAIDAAANGGGSLIMLRSLAAGETWQASGDLADAELHADDGDSVMMDLRMPDGRIIGVSISRREFARLFAAGAMRASLPGGPAHPDRSMRATEALDQRRRIDPEALDYFRALLTEHFTADKMLGARRLIAPVHAQIEILDDLRRHARPRTTEALLSLLAQYAEFAGWLHQDIGDTTAAMRHCDRASQWAQAAGDHQMVAYLLVRKSNIALLDGDAVDVIELAAAATRVPGPLSPRLLALAGQQQARGWALHGDADQFRTELDKAADLLGRYPDDVDESAPVYLLHYDMDALEEQSASCYRACGRAEEAVAVLERRLAVTPAYLHRDRGHQLAKLANTVLAVSAPDPDRAADLGMQCVRTARDTGSTRIDRELRALSASLNRRWPGRPGTLQLHEALSR